MQRQVMLSYLGVLVKGEIVGRVVYSQVIFVPSWIEKLGSCSIATRRKHSS